MNTKHFQGNTFYVDDVTRDLSQRYDVNSYKGYFNTFGEVEIEAAVGRLMSLAKMCAEFVGVDFATYRKRFQGQQCMDEDYPLVPDESTLRVVISNASFYLTPYEARMKDNPSLIHAVRVENIRRTAVYFPTEALVVRMLSIGNNPFQPLER